MSISFYITILLVLFSCCKKSKYSSVNKPMKGVIIERTFPLLDFDSVGNKWVVLRYDPFYSKIFTYEGLTIIQTNYYHRVTTYSSDSISGNNFKSEYYTFLYNDQSDIGVLCDSNSVQSIRAVNKDSMLNKEWVVKIDQGKLLHDNEHTLISAENLTGDLIAENYLFKNRKDTNMTGTIRLLYSKTKMLDCKYSLARDLEENRKMKLLKTVCINFARKIESAKTNIDQVLVEYEIKEIEGDRIELLNLIDNAINILRANNRRK